MTVCAWKRTAGDAHNSCGFLRACVVCVTECNRIAGVDEPENSFGRVAKRRSGELESLQFESHLCHKLTRWPVHQVMDKVASHFLTFSPPSSSTMCELV